MSIQKNIATTSLKTVSQVRGVHVSVAINWIKDVYGERFYQKILERLPKEDRQLLNRYLISVRWYPFPFWDRFLDACQAELKNLTGENEEALRIRLVREAGGKLLKTIYKFVFSSVKPEAAVKKMIKVFDRTFDQGKMELLSNSFGSCLIRYILPEDMHIYIERYSGVTMAYVLELAGATSIVTEMKADIDPQGFYIINLVLTYQ